MRKCMDFFRYHKLQQSVFQSIVHYTCYPPWPRVTEEITKDNC